jgi:V/A-type H+-transporting ATPase subunit I
VLKPIAMKKVRIFIHRDYVDLVLHRLGEIGTFQVIDIKDDLDEFDDKLHVAGTSDKLFKISSLLSRVNSLIDALQIKKIPATKVSTEVPITEERLNQISSKVGIIEEETQKILTQLSELEKTKIMKQEAKQKNEQLKQQLMGLAQENGDSLLISREELEIEKSVEEVKTFMGSTKYTHVIEGWVPNSDLKRTEDAVKAASEGYYLTTFPLSKNYEHEGDERKLPPTSLKNPRLIKVFESLTKAFGIPNYHEIDPTIFWLFSFPIIFGLMFGDIGHGALLFTGGVLFHYVKKKGVKISGAFGQIVNYPLGGATLLMLCGITSIIIGFLYGEVFGSEKLYSTLVQSLGFRIIWTEGPTPVIKDVIEPITSRNIYWFSPWHHPMSLLKYSIYIGMIQISFGLILSVINHLKNHEVKEAVVGPMMWVWLYWSFCILILKFKWNVVMALMNFSMLETYVVFHPVIPLMFMLLLRSISHGMKGMTEALESFLASVSHTVSYARILALKMVHSAFTIIFPFSLTIGGFITFVIGTMFIMTLESLLAFLHSLRLHWIEWFLKFYKGTGHVYQPFVITRRFTICGD